MKYIIGGNIENNTAKLRPYSQPRSPVKDKKLSTNGIEKNIPQNNNNITRINFTGIFFDRLMPLEVKNFPFLKVTLLNFIIKYGTRVKDNKSTTMLPKAIANCTESGIENRNARFQRLF